MPSEHCPTTGRNEGRRESDRDTHLSSYLELKEGPHDRKDIVPSYQGKNSGGTHETRGVGNGLDS